VGEPLTRAGMIPATAYIVNIEIIAWMCFQ
jgi:hypothetical protein